MNLDTRISNLVEYKRENILNGSFKSAKWYEKNHPNFHDKVISCIAGLGYETLKNGYSSRTDKQKNTLYSLIGL